jgi:hypothetical protein
VEESPLQFVSSRSKAIKEPPLHFVNGGSKAITKSHRSNSSAVEAMQSQNIHRCNSSVVEAMQSQRFIVAIRQ